MSEIEEFEAVKSAIREASITLNGKTRSLGYYARVGIDHFNHDFDALAEPLIDEAAKAVIAFLRKP